VIIVQVQIFSVCVVQSTFTVAPLLFFAVCASLHSLIPDNQFLFCNNSRNHRVTFIHLKFSSDLAGQLYETSHPESMTEEYMRDELRGK